MELKQTVNNAMIICKLVLLLNNSFDDNVEFLVLEVLECTFDWVFKTLFWWRHHGQLPPSPLSSVVINELTPLPPLWWRNIWTTPKFRKRLCFIGRLFKYYCLIFWWNIAFCGCFNLPYSLNVLFNIIIDKKQWFVCDQQNMWWN